MDNLFIHSGNFRLKAVAWTNVAQQSFKEMTETAIVLVDSKVTCSAGGWANFMAKISNVFVSGMRIAKRGSEPALRPLNYRFKTAEARYDLRFVKCTV